MIGRVEPTLRDLLADDVRQQAVRSAGLTPSEFEEQLRDLAARVRWWRRRHDEARR